MESASMAITDPIFKKFLHKIAMIPSNSGMRGFDMSVTAF